MSLTFRVPSARDSRRIKTFKVSESRLVGAAFIALLLVLWQLASTHGDVDPALLPPVSTIVVAAYGALMHGALLGSLAESLPSMFVGYLCAAAIGIALGVLMGCVRFAYVLFEPLVEMLRPIPISAFIPLFILFLGIQAPLRIAVVFVASFFPILLSSYSGVRGIPTTMRETALTFRLSWWETIREITLPAAAPAIFVGLRTSLAIALIVEVVSEMIAGNSGIGFYVLQAEQGLRVVDMYVGVLALALVGYGLNSIFLIFESTILHWHFGRTQ